MLKVVAVPGLRKRGVRDMTASRFFLLLTVVMLCFPRPGGAANEVESEEEPLGRLFTTPKQRVSLDFARQKAIRKKLLSSGNKDNKRLVQDTIILNGFVIRSKGPSAVWMNGRSALSKDGGLPVGVKLTEIGNIHGVEVEVTKNKRKMQVQLKTGQRMDGASGVVLEPYEGVMQALEGDAADKEKEKKLAEKRAAVAKQKKSSSAKFDESSLEDMMSKREAFADKIGVLNKLIGQ
jgi:hypothetical protein